MVITPVYLLYYKFCNFFSLFLTLVSKSIQRDSKRVPDEHHCRSTLYLQRLSSILYFSNGTLVHPVFDSSCYHFALTGPPFKS